MNGRPMRGGALLLAAACVLAGCYRSHGRGERFDGPAMDGGAVDGSPQAAGGGGGGPGGGGGSGGGGRTGRGDRRNRCQPFRSTARQAELDIFILKDASRSMALLTEADLTKGTVVNLALTALFRAEESRGIGVTMTLFPFLDREVEETCRAADGCSRGECVLVSTCFGDGQLLCEDDDHCADGERCLPRGRCGRSNQPCVLGSDSCHPQVECIPVGFCDQRTPCEPEVYRRATEPVRAAPRSTRDVEAFFGPRENDGGTPMYPALAGVLDAARDYAAANPTRKVVALLATDGLPSSCDPTLPYGLVFEDDDVPVAIDSIAGVAADGFRRGVPTFVVGVFARDEGPASVSSLNRIALAGGTNRAHLIATDERVIGALTRALAAVRDEARDCSFAVPTPGELPEPETLAVRILSPDGSSVELPRRERAAECNVDGGFHFAPELARGERSGLVELCPVSCDRAREFGAQIEMEVRCDQR